MISAATWPVDVNVVPATEADLETIAVIEAEAFLAPWHPDSFRDALTRPYALFLGLRKAGRLIGYSLSWVIADELHLLKIAVEPPQRGNGYGTYLVEDTLRKARSRGAAVAWLEVRPSNEAALKMYARHGFSSTYRRKNYYTDTGEDAIILVCQLRPKASTT